jgi:hypothetical protein
MDQLSERDRIFQQRILEISQEERKGYKRILVTSWIVLPVCGLLFGFFIARSYTDHGQQIIAFFAAVATSLIFAVAIHLDLRDAGDETDEEDNLARRLIKG